MKIYIQRMITLKTASSSFVQASLLRLSVGATGLELQDMRSVLGNVFRNEISYNRWKM